MNKLIPVTGISVMAVGLLVTSGFLFQSVGNLNAANADLETHKATISGLQTDLAAKISEAESLTTRLADSQAEVDSLQGTVTTLNGQLTQLTTDLTSTKSQLDNTKSLLATTQTQLSSAQSDLSVAKALTSQLTSELKTIKDPRHFASINELTDWLQKDDTDTKYADSSVPQRSYILQVRALRDGFILPVSFYDDGSTVWVWNTARIGDTLYGVNADTDETWVDSYVSPLPSHPDPLP